MAVENGTTNSERCELVSITVASSHVRGSGYQHMYVLSTGGWTQYLPVKIILPDTVHGTSVVQLSICTLFLYGRY